MALYKLDYYYAYYYIVLSSINWLQKTLLIQTAGH